MTEKKNIFGHPSIAPQTTRRSMTEMLQDPPADQFQTQPSSQEMTPGDLEQLVFLGCIEDSKTINGFKFDMRTLTGKEQNDVWTSVSFLPGDTKFLVVKVAFLARSIIAVNGRDLDVLYRAQDYRELTPEQRKTKVVETWQDTLINELYVFYSELTERSRKVVNEEQIKK